MKTYFALLLFIVAVLAGLHIGSRVSPDTIAMTIGVALGALTTIPISLLLGLLVGRRSAAVAESGEHLPQPVVTRPPYPRLDDYATSLRNVPPVVIINPAAWQASSQAAYQPAQLQNVPMLEGARHFQIVGEEAV